LSKRSFKQLLVAAMAALGLAALLVGCSSSASDPSEDPFVSVPLANVDLGNTRDAPGPIKAATVQDLELAWSLPVEAKAEGLRYIGSPVVEEGVVYLQDPRSNVKAVDLETGELLWEAQYEEEVRGANGVIVADGMVFGATRSSAFALDAKTGKESWSTKLVRNGSEGIAMAPGYHGGRVYISTAPYKEEGNEVGVLWALDGKSGKKLWHFDTVPRGLWGKPQINFGGGLYFAPAFDGEGSIYVGISTPGPIVGTARYPWGSSRPGRNLYSNSIVKLDEKTGEVEWFYQLAPHSVCSGGFASPVLTEVGDRKVVIGAGLGGIAVALDRETGKPLWRRPVGVHNGHDNDGLLAMRGEEEKLKTPMVAYPGLYGGVFGLLSVRGSTLFVPVVNGAVRLLSQTDLKPVGPYRGMLLALDVATGAVRWKKSFPTPAFGPTTTTNDLVFATSLDGVVSAFAVDSGEEVWSKKLPMQTEGGMTVAGDTLLVRSGVPGQPNETPRLLAYRLAD
jgi:alcohol dehydrogenase (cytochrome c)